MSKKPIIVFEGIEGTGKSHHINNVARFLRKRNKKFIQIREPGGNKNSEMIRKLILDKKSTFNKYTDLLLSISFLIFSEFLLPPGSLIWINFFFLFFKYLAIILMW